MEITSLQNPRIKSCVKLREKRERDQTDLFLIEGYREMSRALSGGVNFTELFICPELFLGDNEDTLIDSIAAQKVPVYTCPASVFMKISYRDRPDGLIAVAKKMNYTLTRLEKVLCNKKNPLLVIAEAIEKPGNLGTILRSSDGVGADAVIICDRCTDIYNPNVVRASVGTLFTIPVLEAESLETITFLRKHNVKIVAATPHAANEYTQENLSGPVAIVVGTEQLGLSDKWLKQADLQVSIPMLGVADSLNVATATTLLLYEALRQRRA